jgi:hypothetical protein
VRGARALRYLGECALALAGLYAFWPVLRQIVFLFLEVTIGPGAPSVVEPTEQMDALVLAVVLLVGSAAGGLLLRQQGHPGAGALSVQVGVALFALSTSYRFTALIGLFALLTWRAGRRSRQGAWAILGLILLLSLMPIDLSLRASPREFGLVMAADCQFRGMAESNNASEVVCVEGGMWVYNSPRFVWVW